MNQHKTNASGWCEWHKDYCLEREQSLHDRIAELEADLGRHGHEKCVSKADANAHLAQIQESFQQEIARLREELDSLKEFTALIEGGIPARVAELAKALAEVEQERDEWKNLAKSYEGVFSERDEAHAAIRALKDAMADIRGLLIAVVPTGETSQQCLKEIADIIEAALGNASPDREPPFHFCDQVSENLVGPKSACEFCRATGERP